ncbi:MAG: ATP-binding cassette domain-containing protein [Cytophagales bacterium]|nr:ATP-binding cassette domain-containing protein [Cytophagales bacterium]
MIVSASNITKYYGSFRALHDFHVEIPEQSIFGLLGPNGAGKSTFIRILNQIIFSDEGSIHIEGEPLAPKHIARIGYLPEERGLYKKMQVGEQLLFLAQLKGLSKSEASRRIREWLTKFELMPWINKKVEDLSKGMQQKVQFIATVVHQPMLIILDEPFSGFDPVNAELIKDEILQLRSQGATVLFSTHRMESVDEICDHMVMINKSEKVLEGKIDEVKKRFKKNTYQFRFRGECPNDLHIVSEEKAENGYRDLLIKLGEGETVNEFLTRMLPIGDVGGIQEHIPTINSIFIQAVKEDLRITQIQNHHA